MLKDLKPAFTIDLNPIFYDLHKQAMVAFDEAKKTDTSSDTVQNADGTNVDVNISKFNIYNNAINYRSLSFVGSGEFLLFLIADERNQYLAKNDEVIKKLRSMLFSPVLAYMKVFLGESISNLLKESDLLPLVDTNTDKLVSFAIQYRIMIQKKFEYSTKDWNDASNLPNTCAKIVLGIREGAIATAAQFGFSAIGKLASVGSGFLNKLLSFRVNTSYHEFKIPGADKLKEISSKIGEWYKGKTKNVVEWLRAASKISINADEFRKVFVKRLNRDYPSNNCRVEIHNANSLLLYLLKHLDFANILTIRLKDSRFLGFFKIPNKYCIQLTVHVNDPNFDSYNEDSIRNLARRTANEIFGNCPYISLGKTEETSKAWYANSKIYEINVVKITNVDAQRRRSRSDTYTYSSNNRDSSILTFEHFENNTMADLYNILFEDNNTLHYMSDSSIDLMNEKGGRGRRGRRGRSNKTTNNTSTSTSAPTLQNVDNIATIQEWTMKLARLFSNSNMIETYKHSSAYGGDDDYAASTNEKITWLNPQPKNLNIPDSAIRNKIDFFKVIDSINKANKNDLSRVNKESLIYEFLFKMYITGFELSYDTSLGAYQTLRDNSHDISYIKILHLIHLFKNEISYFERKEHDQTDGMSRNDQQDIYLIKIPFLNLNGDAY